MASMLPRPLRTALIVDPHDIDDGESGHDLPERAAKRRRIEIIANQYLTGTVPFIQSATLRGPFDAGWRNPWSKRKSRPHDISSRPAAPPIADRRQRRQPTRELSLDAESDQRPHAHPTHPERPTADPTSRDKERRARAEAERAEGERRKAKAERREQRRQELRKREEKAASLRKDGIGKDPSRPVDFTADSLDAALPVKISFGSLPAGTFPEIDDQDDIVRSREYGAREIRSSFTDEWLSRLGSPNPAKTTEFSLVHPSGVEGNIDRLEAMTPTRRPSKRVNHGHQAPSNQLGLDAKPRVRRRGSPAPVSDKHEFSRAGNLSRDSSGSYYDIGPGKTTETSAEHPEVDGAIASTMLQTLSNGRNADVSTNISEKGRNITLNEDSLPKPTPSSQLGPTEDVQALHKRIRAAAPATSHRRNPSGFTSINQRLSSPPGEPHEHIVSTTPAGRPVLGVKSAANNVNPADMIRPSSHPRNEGVLVMSAGDLRFDNEALHVLGKDLEGQENNISTEDGKQQNFGSALVRSPEKGVKSVLARSKKFKRVHPLQASPLATDSPGFAYRKVAKPTECIPKLQPRKYLTNQPVVNKRRARMMTFDSLPVENPVPLGPEPSNLNDGVDKVAADQAVDVEKQLTGCDEQAPQGNLPSPARDLSTQAAILFAQKEFQQEFWPSSKEKPAYSPEKELPSQRTRTSTPPASQPPIEYTAVTPFKDFNRGKLFLDAPPKLDPPPMSTQELFNGASPFAFSTAKKNKNKRKRVSLAASPLKFADDNNADDTFVEEGFSPTQKYDTTVAKVTIGDISTTPPTPKFPSFAQDRPSSGLKPHSLNPTLSSAIKIRPSRFMTSSRVSSQVTSSFPKLGQTLSSAPAAAPSHALRQEFRQAQSRGQTQGRSQSQSQSQSQGSQRSSQQPAQRQPGLDDVDLNSAMDAADSFLDTANLDLGMRRGTPGG